MRESNEWSDKFPTVAFCISNVKQTSVGQGTDKVCIRDMFKTNDKLGLIAFQHVDI